MSRLVLLIIKKHKRLFQNVLDYYVIYESIYQIKQLFIFKQSLAYFLLVMLINFSESLVFICCFFWYYVPHYAKSYVKVVFL